MNTMLTLICFSFVLLFYAGLVLLLTPLGRRWLFTAWRAWRRKGVPERYPDHRLDHWFQGHSNAMYVVLCVPLCMGIAGYLWPTSPPPGLWLGSLIVRLVLTAAVAWLSWKTVQACRELWDSPWMRARRLIDRGR